MKLSKSELEAVMAASSRAFVPLNKLALSPNLQARPADAPGKLPLSELAASIQHVGLLHNLVVTRGVKGQHDVCAGGRRWRAMQLLVADGRWPENQPVPVLVVPPEQALMASLIENVQREAMHPADELEAFSKLIAEGRSVEDLAAVFGVTPLVVLRRLKLAAVAPALMGEFREGRIGLDCLMLLATVDGHEQQLALWAQLPEWQRNVQELRRLLARAEVDSKQDPVARFVTLEAYEAAGGDVRRDLFSDEGQASLTDLALLERLAVEKLQPTADSVRAEGWLWVEVRARFIYDDNLRYSVLRPCQRLPSVEESAELDSLQAQLDKVHEQMEAFDGSESEEDQEAFARLEAEADALEMRINAASAERASYPADSMGCAGCLVHVGSDGAPQVKRGLVRPEDRARLEALRGSASARADGQGAALVREARGRVTTVHSDKLTRRLTAHRIAGIQAQMLERPDVALAVLVAHLAASLLRGPFNTPAGGPRALTISVGDTHEALRREGEDVAQSAAWKQVEAVRVEWDTALPPQGEKLLSWALAQDREKLLQLLALLVASSVAGVDGHDRDSRATDGVARALGLDMRRWWTATADSYLAHVSKARIAEVVTEAAGANAAAGLVALNKADAVAAAERALAGKGWLPRCLQTPPEVGDSPASSADKAAEP